MSGAVADLSSYRERRTIRRLAAAAVALFGAASFALALWSARDRLEASIRRAAELLPEDLGRAS